MLINIVNQAVKLLLGANYHKTCNRRTKLPKVADAKQAVEYLQALQCSKLLARVETRGPSDESWYRRISHVNGNKPERLPLIMEDDKFFWPECTKTLYDFWIQLSLFILTPIGLYQLRKRLRNLPGSAIFWYRDAYYGIDCTISLMTMANITVWLFVTPFIIILVRIVLFVITHFCCSRGLWLFPNLFTDSTFFGPFSPLYAWDTEPKVSLGMRWRRFRNSMLAELGMFKQRRKNRVKRVRRKLHKA